MNDSNLPVSPNGAPLIPQSWVRWLALAWAVAQSASVVALAIYGTGSKPALVAAGIFAMLGTLIGMASQGFRSPPAALALLLFLVPMAAGCAWWKAEGGPAASKCASEEFKARLPAGVQVAGELLAREDGAQAGLCTLGVLVGLDLAACIWEELAQRAPDPVIAARAGALLNGQCPAE